jgi:hypothetical protein
MRNRTSLLLVAATSSIVGCSVPSSDATIVIEAPSESATEWYPVANYLGHRCGSLVCHGDAQRNFVIYSCDGLRLDATDVPGCPPGFGTVATASDEYNATYRSLVGLEPVVMSQVVASGGADPDLLTFIRKARGQEAHKGGALIVPGDDQDQCLTSWLSGDTNAAACTQAIATTP